MKKLLGPIPVALVALAAVAFARPEPKTLVHIYEDSKGDVQMRHYGITDDSVCSLLEETRNLYCDPFDVSPKDLK